MFFVVVFAGNRAGDGGLPSASHAVQPEDAPLVIPISPSLYLTEDVDSGVREAERVVPVVVIVESCLRSPW
jgi:hypothetical protein